MITRSKLKKLLVVIGRENLHKDSGIYTHLFSNYKVIFEPSDELAMQYDKVISFGERIALAKGIARRIYSAFLKLRFMLKYRDWKGHYFQLFKPHYRDFDYRKAILHHFFSTLKSKYKVIIVGRSAGALLATQLADEFQFEHVICLGYPFKDHDLPDEPYRTEHLAHLKTPTTIYQGTKEVYGRPSELGNYKLSKNIQIIGVDSDHDYALNTADLTKITQQLNELLKD